MSPGRTTGSGAGEEVGGAAPAVPPTENTDGCESVALLMSRSRFRTYSDPSSQASPRNQSVSQSLLLTFCAF